MTIGEALKEERVALGLTQKQMAGDVLSVAEYSKIENMIHKIDADTLLKILALHQIDITKFYKKVAVNYVQNKRMHDVEYLTLDLEKSFYRSDVNRVEQIIDIFDALPDVSVELKLRARLILAVLKGDYSSITIDMRKQIFNRMFNREDWIENQNSLRLFGNSMFLWDFSDVSLMLDRVLDKYEHVRSYPNDVEERIAQICSNYLYNGIRYQKTERMKRAINILKKLDDIPHLVFYKLLGLYFQNYYDGNTKELKNIRNMLKNSGCNELINKFPR